MSKQWMDTHASPAVDVGDVHQCVVVLQALVRVQHLDLQSKRQQCAAHDANRRRWERAEGHKQGMYVKFGLFMLLYICGL